MRLLLALGLGTLVALGLFWFMQYMMTNNQQSLQPTDATVMSEFIRLKPEQETPKQERHVPKKPKLEQRPEPPKMVAMSAQVKQLAAPDMDMPALDMPVDTSAFKTASVSGLKVGASAPAPVATIASPTVNSAVIPLVRIPPKYPRRAARRRIEGWVKIEFTITVDGQVRDAEVVEAKPSSIFNREALNAIKRWKFKPNIVNGVATEQRAVQVLEFKLSQ